MENKYPPNFNWRIWEGPEIEGKTDLGAKTLFIRDITPEEVAQLFPKYDRIFIGSGFVKKGISREDLAWLKSFGKKMVFEIHFEDYEQLVKDNRTDIYGEHEVYLQINNFALKPGDHVKIGNFFQEEIFLCGEGVVTPFAEYLNDVKIG